MNCKQFHEHMLDLMGSEPGPGELQTHLRSCAPCAEELASLRRTAALLDNWAAPADTSPYFMTRLRARMHEQARQPAAWLGWFRKPALALSMTVLMAASISLFQGSWQIRESSGSRTTEGATLSRPGTAVGDLQYLEKNHDLLADFDMLDGLEVSN